MFFPGDNLRIINFDVMVVVFAMKFTNCSKGGLSLECSLNLVSSHLLVSPMYVLRIPCTYPCSLNLVPSDLLVSPTYVSMWLEGCHHNSEWRAQGDFASYVFASTQMLKRYLLINLSSWQSLILVYILSFGVKCWNLTIYFKLLRRYWLFSKPLDLSTLVFYIWMYFYVETQNGNDNLHFGNFLKKNCVQLCSAVDPLVEKG